MTECSRSGEWPRLGPEEYRRLVRLAKRRLAGNDHLAEDVVQRAMIKWTTIPVDHPQARIEQVVKSEATSVLRSELRARERDTRATLDPSLAPSRGAQNPSQRDLHELRIALAQTAVSKSIPITSDDLEVLELLFAGWPMTDTVRLTGLSRSRVRRSKSTWKRIAAALVAEPPDVD